MAERTGGKSDDGTMERIGRSVGEAAGQAADMAAGMAADVAGPLFRSASDVLGGWWSGDAAREAARSVDSEQDRNWREHYQREAAKESAGGASLYEDVRPYYQLGHTASRNPEYASRNFEEVEPELRRVWAEGEAGSREWPAARGFVEFGYGGAPDSSRS